MAAIHMVSESCKEGLTQNFFPGTYSFLPGEFSGRLAISGA